MSHPSVAGGLSQRPAGAGTNWSELQFAFQEQNYTMIMIAQYK